MVRRNGKSYRKASQKGPRGGMTRREQLAEKLRNERRRLRENNLKKIIVSPEAAGMAADQSPHHSRRDVAVYGIYDDGSDWVLTAMATVRKVESISHRKGGGYTETVVRGRYALLHDNPADGVELGRYDTKGAACQEVSADSTNRVETGKYVVRPTKAHSPRALRGQEVDADEYTRFKRRARAIRDA